MQRPLVTTMLPGPRAAEFIRTDETYVSPSYTRVYPLVVERAQGMWVEEVDLCLSIFETALKETVG